MPLRRWTLSLLAVLCGLYHNRRYASRIVAPVPGK
jgi:hypothetical protein